MCGPADLVMSTATVYPGVAPLMGSGEGAGALSPTRDSAVSQFRAMAFCARARLIWPSQTALFSAFSTESFGFGIGPVRRGMIAPGLTSCAYVARPGHQRTLSLMKLDKSTLAEESKDRISYL